MKIFILGHGGTRAGSVEILEEHLLSRGDEVERLMHPLNYHDGRSMSFSSGNMTHLMPRRNRGIFSLAEDFFYSLRYIRKSNIETFIGCTNFDTLPAIIVRKFFFKKIQRIIYYPRDFTERRFGNPFINAFYLLVETAAVRGSDTTFSNTERAAKKRQSLGLLHSKSRIVPNGVILNNPTFENKKIDKDHFVYVGDVSFEHGLDEMIELLHPRIEKLVVIGSGHDWDKTIDLCKKHNVKIEAHHRKSHGFVMEYLKHFKGIGLAPYNNKSDWTKYCSPLKAGEYIASGIPVIISSIPEMSEYIVHKGLGIAYKSLDRKEIYDKLDGFDTREYHQKAEEFYAHNNRAVIFDQLI